MTLAWFEPHVAGTGSIRAEPRVFLAGLARRVTSGLLGSDSSPSRTKYEVTTQSHDRLAFRATNWMTAFNVGLNDVELIVMPDRQVVYTIAYKRWAAYGLLLSAVIGFALAGIFAVVDIHRYVERNPASQLPGLSVDQNVAIAWGMVLFWGFIWPWLLIGMHKRPLRRLMARIIAEVDDTSRHAV
jgi:hypothetical protein